MTVVDPRLPVIVGVGQLNRRVDRGESPLEPVDLMADAARMAEADAGAAPGSSTHGLLAQADAIRVVDVFSWRYRDVATLLATRLGASAADAAVSTPGGNSPQMLVNGAALDIQSGAADVVVIAGAEAWRTRTTHRRSGGKAPWTDQGDETPEARRIGVDELIWSPDEAARGLAMPVQHYPMFENAIRHRLGRSIDEHQCHISELWSRFSEVAESNPNAWIQRLFTPEEIRQVGPGNRMVGFPYPKLMNSNLAVEQGAALVLCSVERARALGIEPDRWVFPHVGTDAGDTLHVSNRIDLHSSPAIRTAGRAALDLAGIGIDDLAHIDLYSCFPSAVQVAAHELKIDLERQVTVTGGLSFAGGPWNNYVTHSIATMTDLLRQDAGAFGLCTANGGYLTKHAFGIYSSKPPASGGFRHAHPQAAVDAIGRRDSCDTWEGPVEVESFTVMHDRNGHPEKAFVASLIGDGRRAWGTTADPDTMEAMMTTDVIGGTGHLTADGDLRLAD